MESFEGRDLRGRLARGFALGGLCLALGLPVAWIDLAPGGYRLRQCFESDAARAERDTQEHALDRLQLFERENPSEPAGAIVFCGSSTIERFPLAELFRGKPCCNRGVANADSELLEHLLARCFAGLRPAGIVLYLGGVDVRRPRTDSTATHVEAILRALDSAHPGVPKLLLGLLPERHMDAAARERLDLLNTALARLASAHGSVFLATARSPLASSSGELAEEFSVDELHLDRAGYALLARWIATEGGPVGRLLAP